MFLEKLNEASIRSGTRLDAATELKQHMIDAGFVDVQDVVFKVRWTAIGEVSGYCPFPPQTEEKKRTSAKAPFFSQLPLSPWPDDPKMKEIGRIRGLAMNQGVEGYSLALYTRYLGWSADEVRILLAKVRNEFNNLDNRMYIAE